MFIKWFLGAINKSGESKNLKVYPMVFSIRQDEIEDLLDWIRYHKCSYMEHSSAKEIIKGYTNKEIIENGLVSMALEQFGNDGSKKESNISIILIPSVMGTRYKIRCKCGEEFEPISIPAIREQYEHSLV
ncbi:MAG: hypothetical protein GX754_07470 [Clostridiaceae bacterium]|nr:hypothetical protein [Clostridiaceae bacterium]